MSRNKDIKVLHLITGSPYSLCRERLKRNRWDLCDALLEDNPFSRATKATREVVSSLLYSLQPAIDQAIEAGKRLVLLLKEAQEEENSQKFNKVKNIGLNREQSGKEV